jgi:translation initiation factor IF-3
LKFAERLTDIGVLESMPKMEGRRMLAMFAPKGKKKADKADKKESSE